MYRWFISYKMKNGDMIAGLYEGPENNSLDVIRNLFDKADFLSHFGMDKDRMIVINIKEISSLSISRWVDKEKE